MDVQRQGGFAEVLRGGALYALCVLVLLGYIRLATSFGGSAMEPAWTYAGVALYLAQGILLSHLVLRRLVRWHANWDTLPRVSRGKLTTALFWPLSYPLLLTRATIDIIL